MIIKNYGHLHSSLLSRTRYSKAKLKSEELDANVEAEKDPKCFADLMDSSNDFSNLESHPVADFYGLSDFIVLKPHTAVQNESQLKLLSK
jgi:hypothetical protein